MEDTVDNFFNEINQIAPPKEHKSTCDWQECFDNTSGYSYYWNMKTDQVTWSIPSEYKHWKEQNSLNKKDINNTNKTTLFPSTLPFNPKIYNIENDVANEADKNKRKDEKNNLANSQEKITLIPAYGDGSDSESEPEKNVNNDATTLESQNRNSPISKNNSDEENIDILTKLHKRVKLLQDLGGELPPDVKKIVEENSSTVEEDVEQKVKQNMSGFSLLASYGDSDDEDEDCKIAEVSSPQTKITVSTLFPVSKPIDVKQFIETEEQPEQQEEIDTKVFQRKKRIGIDLNVEKPIVEVNDVDTNRQGLGFKSEGGEIFQNKSKVNYLGFKSAGVMFLKGDVLNSEENVCKNEVQEDSNKDNIDTMKKIEETHKMLNEKLTFLSEGREPVSPVQVIIIQMETLYEAMQAKSLTLDYLHNWLKQTCSELIKLEKEAAPSGWLLQWDRINKRYYYRNQQTGESQWEYPQPDIVGGDDAMDICTTPPPTASDTLLDDLTHSLQPPPPPRIKSPTPPPPPTISKTIPRKKSLANLHKNSTDVLPALPTENYPVVGEPLPPGVDSPPPQAFQLEKKSNDVLGSELDSFYSDLAAMENNPSVASSSTDTVANTENSQITKATEATLKRKKKPKVKLVEGLAMKKKGVSKLVERWKNVQKDL